MKMCEISKRRLEDKKTIPAKFLSYFSMCHEVSHEPLKIQAQALPVRNDLPFVSSITSRYSADCAIKTHWSFLKY